MQEEQSSVGGHSNLGTRPLVVVEWDRMEPAARELYSIWQGRHDLHWARYVWSKLEKVSPDFDSDGEEIANSLVLLFGLALLSSAFWDAAWDEPGTARYRAESALSAIELDRFYVGQLWPWAAPKVGDASPDMNEIFYELAVPVASVYAREVLKNMTADEVTQFFESVPFLPGDNALVADIHHEDDDGHALPKGIMSELLMQNQRAVYQWIDSGFPV